MRTVMPHIARERWQCDVSCECCCIFHSLSRVFFNRRMNGGQLKNIVEPMVKTGRTDRGSHGTKIIGNKRNGKVKNRDKKMLIQKISIPNRTERKNIEREPSPGIG